MDDLQHMLDDDHEDHGGHGEPWLVSYADLMTLLFGFFVLMYSFASKENKSEFIKVKKELARQFGGQYIEKENQLKKDLDDMFLKNKEQLQGVGLSSFDEGLLISFQTKALFEVGSADLQKGFIPKLTMLVDVIKVQLDDYDLVIEGHTDDSPISSLKFPSNWELSAGRAASVARFLEEHGFERGTMKVLGYADTQPLLPNKDETGKPIPDNRAQNRRVVIRLVEKNPMKNSANQNSNNSDKS